MPLRRLFTLLVCLLLCAALPARAGTTYTFAGKKFDDCTLSSKVYTCSRLPLGAWDDAIVIGKGYTVNVTSDVYFGYNQGLSMSGGATLTSTGNLNIGGIAGSLLQVNDASFAAGGQFSMGAQQQSIVADIRAATMQLGTGSQAKITGTIAASGAIDIASNVTIVGPVSGTVINTNSPVAITGDVTASTSFFLASHSKVKGNITAPAVDTNSPVTIEGNVTAVKSFNLASGSVMTGNVKSGVVNLYAAGVVVNGSIEATTSLRLGSGDVVNGDIRTGELTLDASNSAINGNATVDHATLQWAARVTDTIYCAKGSTPGKCDCVSNYSGYEVRNIKTYGNGPYCEGKTQPLHHFVIAHDARASVCAPSSVSVTACADAACSATYGSGAAVYLRPGGQRIDIGAGGTASAAVQLPPGAAVTLGLADANGAALPASCRLSGSNGAASNCTLQVSDAALALDILTREGSANEKKEFVAADDGGAVPVTIDALVYDPDKKACTPLFAGKQRDIAFSFGYDNPSTGTQPILIGGKSLKAGAEQLLSLDFDANGKARTTLSYPDAGRLKLDARYAGSESHASGSVLATAAPASFAVALSDLPVPRKAGSPFKVTVTAMNAAREPKVTPNFGRETPPVTVKLSGAMCRPSAGTNGFVAPDAAPAIGNGVQVFAPAPNAPKPAPRMDEVGSIDVQAALADGYLGTNRKPTGSSNLGGNTEAACTGASGDFVPAFFKVETDPEWKRTTTAAKIPQYYADERAISLVLSARNLGGGVTGNYQGKQARDVALGAVDLARKVPDKPFGSFVRADTACASGAANLVCKEFFDKGIARKWTGGGFVPSSAPAAPATVRVRATETTQKTGELAASSLDAPEDAFEPVIQVLSGRARLSSNYGYAGKPLTLALTLEYWDGRAWRRNFDDSYTPLPETAFALSTADNPAILAPDAIKRGWGKPLQRGAAELVLTPPAGSGRGNIDVALNLGASSSAGAGQDASCLDKHPPATPANAPFLRAADASCPVDAQKPRDPRARATFGIFAPETRRIIHVREVFR